ncbi:MAG: AbrB/MazE/SpoVT family DNA-binding domain-containing protein [Methanobacteriota archaeon]|nr:MAG: AbrB/MazE/SpoVT family DNA-binding domain-containing protein [Euryarchaeota archaeon]
MVKEEEACCDEDSKSVCCSIESVVSVDERGQMVLPKEVREKAGINPGDKLAVVMMKEGEESCCITLIKVTDLSDSVKVVLGPMMKEVSGE